MNTSKSVLVFVSIYFMQWIILSGIVTFTSGMLFKEAISYYTSRSIYDTLRMDYTLHSSIRLSGMVK